jgi:hypothetical protein
VAEGDTILRLARRLDAALGGQTISVTAPNRRGRTAGVERLDGRRLEAAERTASTCCCGSESWSSTATSG